jgi:high-affinity nickel permease
MLVKLHAYVMRFPSKSLEAVPSSWTVAPILEVWFGPAFATGAEFTVLMVTVAGALLAVPSFTTN